MNNGFNANVRIHEAIARHSDGLTRAEICHFAFRGNQCWNTIDEVLDDLQYQRAIRAKVVNRAGGSVRLYQIRIGA